VEFIPTVDPTLVIIYRQLDIIIYFNPQSFESWVIWGMCNLCGDCIEGAVNPSYLPYELRQDVPLRPHPELESKKCVLRGEYL
jgi:hypothetical protein